jgi:hypothetical protein
LLIFPEGGGSYEWLVAGENTGSRAARVEGRERICCDPPDALRHSGVTGESESEDDDHIFKKFTLAAYALEKAND